MTVEYYSLLTDTGALAMSYAAANNTPVNLSEVALGDGGGVMPIHTASSTSLVNEVFRAPISSITQHDINPAWYVVELVVPPEIGGFWVREFRIDDDNGDPIYIGVTPSELKPVLASGSMKDNIYRLIVAVANSATINLVVDSSVVLATQDYVNYRLGFYIPLAQKGAALGVATLDSNVWVPMAQMNPVLATDVEVAGAILAHEAAPDPHPQYLMEVEMDARLMSKRATRYYHANF